MSSWAHFILSYCIVEQNFHSTSVQLSLWRFVVASEKLGSRKLQLATKAVKSPNCFISSLITDGLKLVMRNMYEMTKKLFHLSKGLETIFFLVSCSSKPKIHKVKMLCFGIKFFNYFPAARSTRLLVHVEPGLVVMTRNPKGFMLCKLLSLSVALVRHDTARSRIAKSLDKGFLFVTTFFPLIW